MSLSALRLKHAKNRSFSADMDDYGLRQAAVYTDSITVTFYLKVPRNQVILLQTYFELYDGVGTVRTISSPDPIVCVMTTRDLIEDCVNVLLAIRSEVQWSVSATQPADPGL
jgi:hypothetical protein